MVNRELLDQLSERLGEAARASPAADLEARLAYLEQKR